jgi:hypothetical protein
MYAGFNLQDLAKEFPEVFRYTRVGPNVASLPATSVELGDATAQALGVCPTRAKSITTLLVKIVMVCVLLESIRGMLMSTSNA